MHLPRGFLYAGAACGIKSTPVEDISLVSCPQGAVAAGVYTQNLVYSPAVAFDRARTPLNDCRAVVTNSGNANTCTGERGVRDNAEMAQLAALATGDSQAAALVMSTGIIGEYLPMEKVRQGIAAAGKQLAPGEEAFLQAARGILTTDRGVKIASRSCQGSSIAAMAKGAGMIGPRMATMLSLITTDATLNVRDAQSALRQAVDRSFNRIRVEGHMSTSDTVLLLASGASGAPPIQGDCLESFTAELTGLCVEVAKMIPDDGEGASHLIEVHVEGAEAEEEAIQIARSIVDSPLVRAGIAGNDPNWGRIISAAGYAGPWFDVQALTLRLNDILLYERGAPVAFDHAAAHQSLQQNRVARIDLQVGAGPGQAVLWGSDLTVEYVRFNSEYHT